MLPSHAFELGFKKMFLARILLELMIGVKIYNMIDCGPTAARI